MGHISKEAADRAKQSGGRVTSLKVRAKPKKAPVKPVEVVPVKQPVVDLEPLKEIVIQQAVVSAAQGEEQSEAVRGLVAALANNLKDKEPQALRLKCHRCEDRSAPNYLLIEYIDVVPIKRKAKS